MKTWQLNSSRLIVGLILVALAVLMLLFLEGDQLYRRRGRDRGAGPDKHRDIEKEVDCVSRLLLRP